ncbi:MAG: enoyl-CoA hydratase-related protein [Acidimicrobiales bacterium]
MSVVVVERPRPEVALVSLNRPERLNALSIDLSIELASALEAVGADNAVRVIVLTGAGRAFCSGLDLKDYGVVPNIDGLQVGQIAQRSMRVYSRLVPLLRGLRQPVIAAVNGPAFGGGLCLALACDLRVAGPGASFNATGIVNGLTSTEMGASWLLPRQVGVAVANDLLLTGRVVDAAEALRIGLVSRLAESEVVTLAMEMADGMCRFSPYGLSMTKDLLWANLEVASLAAAIELEDRNQLMLGFTENLPEAIRAFDEGRQPVYTDEPRKDLFEPRQ